MGQVLNGSATTTEAVLRAIQNSKESLRALSGRYGINQKTVAKWKTRTSLADLPTGLNCPHFRPDTQHKQEGSSTGLRIGLCLTSFERLI